MRVGWVVLAVVTLALWGVGCGSKEVVVNKPADETEMSPEEQQVQEHLKQMMQNPMAPPAMAQPGGTTAEPGQAAR